MEESLSPIFISPPKTCLQVPDLSKTESYSILKFSLILLTDNHQKTIASVIEMVTTVLDSSIYNDYEVIVVDNQSIDRTGEIALELVSIYPQLRVMQLPKKTSLAVATIRGWQIAKGQILGVIPADLQYPPGILVKLLEKIDIQADLAVASYSPQKNVSKQNFTRTLGLIILPEIISRITDPFSNYFLVKRKAIANLLMSPLCQTILIEVIARGKIINIAEVDYDVLTTAKEQTDIKLGQYLKYYQYLLRLRISLSIRFVRFCIVGISGVFLDMIALYFLSDVYNLNLPLSIIKLFSAEIGVINNFWWNDAWTFRDIAKTQPGLSAKLKRLLKFNFVCLTGLIFGAVILEILYTPLNFKSLPAGKYLANFLAIGAITFWNYWLHSKLSWRRK